MRARDFTGEVFGLSTVVRRAGSTSVSGRARLMWLLRCQCGVEFVRPASNLGRRGPQSCGCRSRELSAQRATKHGAVGSLTYGSWVSMHRRCSDPRRWNYKYYGGRGIAVCDRWSSFEAFLADMGPRPSPRHTIDRVDNDLGYAPSNCRWATQSQQMRNTRRKH